MKKLNNAKLDGKTLSKADGTVRRNSLLTIGKPCLTDVNASNISCDILSKSLKARFDSGLSYSSAGDRILVATNTNLPDNEKHIDHLPTDSFVDDITDSNPHIYTQTALAYLRLEECPNQAVVALGMSGSGKSFQIKKSLKHLSAITRSTNSHREVTNTDVEIFQALEILEIFGNSSTRTNPNASHYSLITTVQLNKSRQIVGAQFVDLLFERQWITNVPEGDFQYHIFYYLISGASAIEHDELKLGYLSSNTKYGLLVNRKAPSGSRITIQDSSSEALEVPCLKQQFNTKLFSESATKDGDSGLDTINHLNRTKSLMQSLGIHRKLQTNILKFLAGILHLSSIEFSEDSYKKDAPSSIKNKTSLSTAAELLQIDEENLETAMTCRLTLVGDALCTNFLNKKSAENARDALIVTLYNLFFSWLLKTLNSRLYQEEETEKAIIYADIASTNLQSNSALANYELLCRDYVAASISHHFSALWNVANKNLVDETFINRPEVLVTRSTTFSKFVNFMNDPDCGLLKLLGQQTEAVAKLKSIDVQEKTSFDLLEQLQQSASSQNDQSHQESGQLTNSSIFKPDRTKRSLFTLQHYHGAVKYDASEFVEHDTAFIRPEFMKLFQTSTSTAASKRSTVWNHSNTLSHGSFLTELTADLPFDIQPKSRANLTRGMSLRGQSGRRPSLQKTTITEDPLELVNQKACQSYGIQLKQDLEAFLSNLELESTWFILTVLCNNLTSKEESHFNQSLVKAQMEYFNLVGWVNLARNAPFLSLKHADFFQKYFPTIALQNSTFSSISELQTIFEKTASTVTAKPLSEYQLEVLKGGYSNLETQALQVPQTGDAPKYLQKPSNPEILFTETQTHIFLKGWGKLYANSAIKNSLALPKPRWTCDDEDLFDLYFASTSQSGNVVEAPRLSRAEDSAQTINELKEQAKMMMKQQREREKNEQQLRDAELKLQRKKEQADLKRAAKELAKQEKEASRPKTLKRKLWMVYTYALTWYIPFFAIKYIGGMRRLEEQLAWREKVTLFLTVGILSFIMLFIIEGLPMIFCPKSNLYTLSEVSKHNSMYRSDGWIVSWRGQIINYGGFSHPAVSTTLSQNGTVVPDGIISKMAGGDARDMFPGFQVTDGGKPIYNSFGLGYLPQSCYPSSTVATFSGTENTAYSSANNINNYVTTAPCDVLSNYFCHSSVYINTRANLGAISGINVVGRVAFSKSDVSQRASVNNGAYVTLNDKVYSLKNLFTYLLALDNTFLNNKNFLDALYNVRGSNLKGSLSSNFVQSIENNIDCFDDAFLAGYIDTRASTQCVIASNVLLACTIIVVGVMVFKFITAIFLVGSKRMPEFANKYVLCQVPCYSESEESLLKTVDSIALTEYEDTCKLIFLIADGMVKGSGNDKPTPELLLNILGIDPDAPNPALSYHSIATGSKQLNCAKIYSGWYSINARQVPYIAVIKVGNKDEISKPGNRGKRDSQMILMKFLNKVHYQLPMSPMELEIYRSMLHTVDIDPILFEYCLMVDADTEVLPDSILRLVASCVNDANIMGICGETVIANERKSAVTMIQVYEYYISHHLAKAFESLFGSVTCLPGCFSLYRIRCSQKHIPILASSDIIKDYENNVVDTLHMKNLLSLGEDRYLTTLMLRYFPSYRTKFVPDARCRTIVPDEFKILLSQRRRWINSTVHNMFELLLLKNLCGCAFVFSMRTIVFLDLFATLVSPAAVAYLVYLIVHAIMAGGIDTIAVIMIAASYGIQALVFIIKGQLHLLGWMLVSLLAIPIFNFWLPLYAYWHFDDFSWGNTRKIAGMKGSGGDHGGSADDKENQFDPKSIPVQTWAEYEKQIRDVSRSSTSGRNLLLLSHPLGKKKRRNTGAINLSQFSPANSPHDSFASNKSDDSTKRALKIRRNIETLAVNPNSHIAISDLSSTKKLDDASGREPAEMVLVEEVLHSPTRKPHSVSELSRRSVSHVTRRTNSVDIDSDEDTILAEIKQSIPSRDQLYYEIQRYIVTADLTKVTKKVVREHLEEKFNCNLDNHKDIINQMVEKALYDEK